ncbi:hypothetical protein [Paracidovorax citrulli]|uniref:hypothetical protein n=1 Tax=Paracidovorax citrulli TaxID=80869 RepID=UPI000B2E26D2|nr:hypothetical protein [Paracidovorax citrulli]
MTLHHEDNARMPKWACTHTPEADAACPSAHLPPDTAGHGGRSQGQRESQPVSRGITARVGAWPLQQAIWLRSLTLVDRFRVIRTIDVAVHCFAERPFKAALSAAQRAVRGMVKAGLLARYRTDRFMTVYGLTQRGADWLDDHGVEAAASVRRVTDMTNPEHRLWAQFLVLCAEARSLQAWTEPELLKALAERAKPNHEASQGLLIVHVTMGGKRRRVQLRPDAAALEPDGGLTWFEVDRSARGSDRAASLRALVLSVGAPTALGLPLRRVIVHTRTERIRRRVLASLAALAEGTASVGLAEGRRRLLPKGDGCFEVWLTVEQSVPDGRVRLVDLLVGHVLVQELPVWLPRVRLDGRGAHSTSGWFNENVLPYSRPSGLPTWPAPRGVFANLSYRPDDEVRR